METTYRVINALDEHHIPQLMDLYRAEWWTRTRTVEQVCDTLKWSDLVMGLCSQPGERLVAFARVLTDTRERQREFDERGPLSASELLARITSAVNEADRVLATVAPSTLLEHRRIQN